MRESRERAEQLKERKANAAQPPSLQSICLQQTLYSPIQLNPERDEKLLERLRFSGVSFDAHCVHCGQTSTFRTLAREMPEDTFAAALKSGALAESARKRIEKLVLESGQFAIHLNCLRRPDHIYSYFFTYDAREGLLSKIGQDPSLEDVAGADIERYRHILGADFAELRRATGLFAHGIGIGSFVYLRRIFENLVERARQAADTDDVRKEEILAMRMSERVQELAVHLPPAVVRYKGSYSILSKGIHELTEAECKQYFPVIRAAIITMLEQRYEAEQKAKAEADLDRAMASMVSANKTN